MIVCGPGPRAEVVKSAWPPALRAIGPLSGVAPSEKVTVPSVTGAPPAVTVAVNVTGSPKADGFGEASSAVCVAAGRLNVATTGSWSEMRSGRVGSFRSDSGKSASARANWTVANDASRLPVTRMWSMTWALPSKEYE